MALVDEIRKDTACCFKRIYMKRRLGQIRVLSSPPTGIFQQYESDWQEITDYVLECSPITWNIDDENLNEFTQGDFTLTIDNNTQAFSPEDNSTSLFSGYLTRHKTKIKVIAGYVDNATGTEYAYDIGVGLINADEISMGSDGIISIPVVAPTMLFDEESAESINLGILPSGTTTSATSYHLIDAGASFDKGNYIGKQVKNVTNPSDVRTAIVTDWVSGTELILDNDIFGNGDTYEFGQTKWYYDTNTTTQMMVRLWYLQKDGWWIFLSYLDNVNVLGLTEFRNCDLYDFSGMTVREAFTKLCEICNSCFYVGADWILYFKTKEPTMASVFTLNNLGVDNNIYAATDYNDGLKKLVNRVEWSGTDPVLYREESNWGIGDTSSIWKYGKRIYTFDNPFAQEDGLKINIADEFLRMYQMPKEEITLTTKFLPQVKLLDTLTVNYTGSPTKDIPTYWNKSYWNKGLWTGRTGGINLVNRSMRVIKLEHDIMEFSTNMILRGY